MDILGIFRRSPPDLGLIDQIESLTQARDALQVERDRYLLERDAAIAERDRARAERDTALATNDQLQCRVQTVTKDMSDLLAALAHAEERLRALIRREFAASSERVAGIEGYIPEVLAALREQGLVADTAAQEAATDQAATDQDQAAPTGPDAPAGSSCAAATSSPAASPDRSRGRRRRPPGAGGRKPLPEDIERRESIYTPPADHPDLRNAVRYEQIGTRAIERWNVGSLDLHIQRIVCPVFRVELANGARVQQVVTPPAVIDRGQVSDGLLVQSAVDKVVDHLPAYRQEQRTLRLGIHIPRAKLCRWHMELAKVLRPVADAVLAEVLQSPVVGIDDTVHRLLVPGRPTCQQARIWAVSAPQAVVYEFTPTREGQWITALLKGYAGGIIGDAYAGHGELLRQPAISALFCWAHVRRKFFEAADTDRRDQMLALIAALYGIEQQLAGRPRDQRAAIRQRDAPPILAQIKDRLDRWQSEVLPASAIGRAVSYALKLWPGLIRYVNMPEAPLDNNATERGMRPIALHRKNSLFSASEQGAKGYATLLTLTQTALLEGLEPVAYLNAILVDLHSSRRSAQDLTPRAYARRQTAIRPSSSTG